MPKPKSPRKPRVPKTKPAPAPAPGPGAGGAGRIEHVVFIIKENHCFDNYFGTFPGANGMQPAALAGSASA